MKYISLKDSKNKIYTFFNNQSYLIKEEILSKKILDNINGYSLDKEQRKAVLVDEDALLIVAGAGSGKTLTMMGKIRYLVEHKKINPKDILVLSFTNFTVNSFKNSLKKNVNYDIDVLTFHKLGINILRKAKYKFKICSDNALDMIVRNYFENDLLLDKKRIYDFVNYFIILSNEKIDNYDYDYATNEEIVISNFLYCNNINFKYIPHEIKDEKIKYAFYLKDYNLYIKYEESLNNEVNCNEHFIVMSAVNFIDGDIFKVLYAKLIENNVKVDGNNYFEIADIFMFKSNKIINLYSLVITFINVLKNNDLDISVTEKILKKVKKCKEKMEINKYIFILSLIKDIFNKYESYLKENNLLDYNDLINISSTLIKDDIVRLSYKYIIIDEFQDTSLCRYRLINNIKKQTCSKLIAVGDDFQSIYRFTGCDVRMFLNFKKYFPYAKILYITNTYRNSSDLVKVAGSFIMKNESQMQKN